MAEEKYSVGIQEFRGLSHQEPGFGGTASKVPLKNRNCTMCQSYIHTPKDSELRKELEESAKELAKRFPEYDIRIEIIKHNVKLSKLEE